jgi:hypothetical protein
MNYSGLIDFHGWKRAEIYLLNIEFRDQTETEIVLNEKYTMRSVWRVFLPAKTLCSVAFRRNIGGVG